MDKVLKREFGITRANRIVLLFSVTMFALVTIVIYHWVIGDIVTDALEEGRANMTNICELNAELVDKEIENRRYMMASIANYMRDSRIEDRERILVKLQAFVEKYNMHNMGLLTPDGILYTTSGKTIDVTDFPQYMNALQAAQIDKDYISESFMPADGGERRVNLFTAPVRRDGTLKYVVTATYFSEELTATMNVSALDEKGYNFLMLPSGGMAVQPRHNNDAEYQELMEYIHKNQGIAPRESGFDHFKFKGESYVVRYELIGVNNWYLMTCMREGEVFARPRSIIFGVGMAVGLLWLLVLFSLGMMSLMMNRFHKRMQQTVYKDRLLGQNNFAYLQVVFPHMTAAERREQALVALDVDKFKEYNFLYGTEEGDELLRFIDRAFREALPRDEIYRSSADLFVAMLRYRSQTELVNKLDAYMQRLTDGVERGEVQPFEPALGVRMMDGTEAFAEVYSDAIIAKNTTKGNHRRHYAIYNEEMRKKRLADMEMESEFQSALHNDEFKVFYQPKYDMRTGRIVGSEALVRWFKPDGTIVSPGVFIPCFEESRQIIDLDEDMLRKVCRQMKEMQRDGLPVQPVSINLSRVHLRHPGIGDKIGAILNQRGIDPALLQFEITESALYVDNIPLQEVVTQLHKLGCMVNMDDYGTGVSSARSLANIAFDVVKIDKSFIDEIEDDKMGSVIRSTINLAADLGMQVIAEGVEQKSQADRLVAWGCYHAQGYFYSKPVPEAEYRAMLAANG